jgi:hypothetical protein
MLWIGDATYIPTDEGWLYLATVIDACSRRLMGARRRTVHPRHVRPSRSNPSWTRRTPRHRVVIVKSVFWASTNA